VKDSIIWNIEAVTLTSIAVCISMSFYLAFLSFQTLNESWRRQLVISAIFFLMAGASIFAALTIHLGIKRAILRRQTALERKQFQ
jgi:hypothetical protein